MTTLREFLRRLWYVIRRDRYLLELEEEMQLHTELRAESIRRGGMRADDAMTQARRRFGNITTTAEASSDAWGFSALDRVIQDVRFAARRLRVRLAFSIPVIAVLSLGIGATTAVFSAVDAAMLRSLPFPRDHELVSLTDVEVPFAPEMNERAKGRLLDLLDVAELTDVFSGTAAYAAAGLNLSDPEQPVRIKAGIVTSGFFNTLGVTPLRGRTFTAEEGKPNGPLAVVLSYGLWQRQYGGSQMVGKTITLHGRPYTVVGIMRPGFDFPNESELWIPMSVPTTFATFEPFRGFLPSKAIARIRTGLTPEVVNARLLAQWTHVTEPATGEHREQLAPFVSDVRTTGSIVPLRRELLGDRRTALLVLLGTTALLLIVACANVANLLLSDAAVRRREIAVREVLGATRGRIVRQLLAESMLLALTGGIGGVLMAPAVLKVVRAMMPATLAGVANAQLDWRVLAFAALLAIATSIVFGLWPAIGVTRGDASRAIKSGGDHGATAGVGKVRGVLVVVEMGLTAMLLVAAGLMLRSFERLTSQDTGMNAAQVATLETAFPRSTSNTERRRVINGVIERLTGASGILAAGAVNDLPLRGGGGISITVDIPGAPPPKLGEYRMARFLFASPGYFATMGIARLRGRTFLPSDASRPNVAIISGSMADQYWPGVDPIGRYVRLRGDTNRLTVVGVVADVRELALDREIIPQMYRPIDIAPLNAAIVVRGTLPPSALTARLTEAVRSVAPGQAVYNVRMMDQVVSASVLPRRTNTMLIALFAALGLTLASLGVYAVVSYGVAQRTRELGIRAALGATGADLLRLVSRETAVVVTLGIVMGLAGAWALSRVLASLLYQVNPRDPATFALVPVVLVLPAVVATVVPALRAARVDPTQVMRSD